MAKNGFCSRSLDTGGQSHQAASAAIQCRSEGQQELELCHYHERKFSSRSHRSRARAIPEVGPEGYEIYLRTLPARDAATGGDENSAQNISIPRFEVCPMY